MFILGHYFLKNMDTKPSEKRGFISLHDICCEEPYEWMSSKEIRDYIISTLLIDSIRIFPELPINDELVSPDLCTFNAISSQNSGVDSKKVLYHFYNLCKGIFSKIRGFLTKLQIDFYYNEDLSNHVILTIKFCNDIKTIQIDGYYLLLKEATTTIYNDKWLSGLFALFTQRQIKKDNSPIKFGIPRMYSKWANDRGYCTDYGGFVCYL